MRTFIQVLLCAFFFYCFLGCRNKTNVLELEFGPNINSQNVRIDVAVSGNVPRTPIFNGSQQFIIPKSAGPDDWYFTYNDTLKGYFRHEKLDSSSGFKYRFHFNKKNGKYYVQINIDGSIWIMMTEELKTQKKLSFQDFDRHFITLDSAANAHPSDTGYACCMAAVRFMEANTGIKPSSEGTIAGNLNFSRNDLYKWHAWFTQKSALQK